MNNKNSSTLSSRFISSSTCKPTIFCSIHVFDKLIFVLSIFVPLLWHQSALLYSHTSEKIYSMFFYWANQGRRLRFDRNEVKRRVLSVDFSEIVFSCRRWRKAIVSSKSETPQHSIQFAVINVSFYHRRILAVLIIKLADLQLNTKNTLLIPSFCGEDKTINSLKKTPYYLKSLYRFSRKIQSF